MIIAWDLDGVINRGVVDGQYLWLDALEQQFEIDGKEFASYIFQKPRWNDVLIGKIGIESLVSKWIVTHRLEMHATDLIKCWHENDMHFDSLLFGIIDACVERGYQNILVSNQDQSRCDFVSKLPEIDCRFDQLFCSSGLGIQKTHSEFYSMVQNNVLSEKPQRFALIDDDIENIRAARGNGWATYFVTQTDESQIRSGIVDFINSLDAES